jgi:ubiquinone/menaquinone biosynthesis C-methylase UbiE
VPRYDADWVAMLSSEERARVTRPDELLRAAGAAAGSTVVDYGSGPGFLTIPAADAVGPTGRVIAVDVEPRMHALVGELARGRGLANVECLYPDAARGLPDGLADVVGAALFLHDLPPGQRDELLRELHRLCRPGGQLLVIEWIAPGGLAGPSTETRFAAPDLADLLSRHGFSPATPRPLGDRYFAVLAEKGVD